MLTRILTIAFAHIFLIQASAFAYNRNTTLYKDAVETLKNMSKSDKEAFFDSFSQERNAEEQHYLKKIREKFLTLDICYLRN